MTETKQAPSSPPKNPIIKKKGKSAIVNGLESKDPNLIAPAFTMLAGVPSANASSKPRVKLLTLPQKKIFQQSSKFQKVAGAVIS